MIFYVNFIVLFIFLPVFSVGQVYLVTRKINLKINVWLKESLSPHKIKLIGNIKADSDSGKALGG